jgi:hypothetical protein
MSRIGRLALFLRLAEWSFSGVQNAFLLHFLRREFKPQVKNRPEDGFTHGFPYGFPPMKYLNHDKRMRCGNQIHKSGHGKKRGKGGSDPGLCGFQPPKKPQGRSRPFSNSFARVHASELTNCNARRTTNFNRRSNQMALLKAPSRQPKTANVQVRLEEEVRCNLDKYAEFLDATPSYVVSEALKLLCRKDKEFQNWLSKHSQETHEPNKGAASLPESK